MVKITEKKVQKGSALAYGLIIMFAVSIILVSTLQFVVSQMKYSLKVEQKEQAFQMAEAGINFFRWYLAKETDLLIESSRLRTFWANGNVLGTNGYSLYPYEVEYPQGSPIGKYRIEVAPPVGNSTIFTVKSTGWTYKDPNLTRTIQVRFRRQSWSEWAVITNSDIRFGEGTTIEGKIHSNGGIRFDGLAKNVVSSSLGLNEYFDPDHCEGSWNWNHTVCSFKKSEFAVHTHRKAPPLSGSYENWVSAEAFPNDPPERSDVFAAGREFSVESKVFEGFSVNNSDMKEAAQNGNGRYFDNTGKGRRIILKDDGTFDVCTVNQYNSTTYVISNYKRNTGNQTCNSCSGNCVKNYPIPDNGIIFVENNIWVEGKIKNKKVTIVAANSQLGTEYDIYIGKNNLTYTNYDGSDIIGLVAQNDISVVYDSLDTLNIDAALLAQNGRVGRNSYDGNYKTSLTFRGAMATKLRYGFAYVGTDHNCGGGVSIANGYCTRNLKFDSNLLDYPPPFFPTTGTYEIDRWEEL